ncbi:uncharacterized protein LOC135366189 isoform X2 [Ornithodoros turicata]|uniref:uncharacterized protein LOC135366189 isoform X2 n=1 Tax=Ornithodoros turicata TaxID=34597 RepID=UPI003138B40D
MPILYTDGSADASTAGAAAAAHRDDSSTSKKRRKKGVIGRFGRAVAKSFKTGDKNYSRHKDVEVANEKLRQLNHRGAPGQPSTAEQLRKTTRYAAQTKRSAPVLGEQQRHHDLAGRLSDGQKSNSESSKDTLRCRDGSPPTRHPHGISSAAHGVRSRYHHEPKSYSEETASYSMHRSDSTPMNVDDLRQEVEESFAAIDADSPLPSSSMSTANLSISDQASLGAQQVLPQPYSGPAVLDCGQMQEVKLPKSAGDDFAQQRSISKNTAQSDTRDTSMAVATNAELEPSAAADNSATRDACVQTDDLVKSNTRVWHALRSFFSALRDCFLCSALVKRRRPE